MMANGERLARALAWFGIGIGLAEIAAPRDLARLIGVGDGGAENALRALGAREIASGAGILVRPRPAGWLWARVGGDAMDLALLWGALNAKGAQRERIGATAAAVAGVMVLDVLSAIRLSRRSGAAQGRSADQTIAVEQAVTINRPAEELYRYWRDFEHLPRVMRHLESVRVSGDGRSHWKAKAPGRTTVEWDAEVVEDRPNELIAWRSLPGADVPNTGSVSFAPAPGDRGTEVRVELRYDPPAGKLGALVAKLFGEEPNQQARDDLRAFKQVMETGEVVVSEGTLALSQPGQPPA